VKCERAGEEGEGVGEEGESAGEEGENKSVWLGGRDRVLGRACLRAAAAASAVTLGGCGLLGGKAALRQSDSQVMTVTSPEFGQGRAIPRLYTCRGRGETPPISWSGTPPGTRALALVVDDADAPIAPYVYWIVFNINPQITDIQANHLPPGALQAVNSRGTVGYAPPCPSRSHQYRFTIYALNALLPLKEGASLTAAVSDMASRVVARGRLDGVISP
jgi:Raf kinase inhibitor-like YbhB/YbcL family protein